MSVMSFIRKNKFYFLGLLILCWVVFVNLFPKGYVFAGGDTTQMISLKSHFEQFFFDWEARAFFYYAFFYLLDSLKLSDSVQLSFCLGIIIFGAYISFDIFSRLIFKRTSDFARMGVSLFYALNLYTLFLFLGNWGYSYFPSLYIFIPLLVGFFLKLVETKELKFGAFFVLTLLPASSGFGNPAFFISFLIFLSLIFLFLLIFGMVKLDRKMAIILLILAIASFLISAFWIFPLLPQMRSGVESVASSNVLEFNWFIRNTASPIWNTWSLIHFSRDYFPYNFPYKNIAYLKNVIIAISFLPMLVVFFGAIGYGRFKAEKRKYFLVFSGVMLVMTMLIARLAAPFEIINYYLYNIWGMNTLRSFDKTAIYFPFILAFLMIMALNEIGSKKLKIGFLMVILLIPFPFYLGKLQQNVGYRFSGEKNYKTASMSFLVKIPEDYYNIRKIINNDPEKAFIVSMPATKNDGTGISDFPKWKLYGFDVTRFLYDKKFIQANDNYFGEWNFAESFNEDLSGNYGWLVELLGIMNGKYIIYHKDATADSVWKSQFKMKNLEEKGLVTKLEDNEYFNLYEIKDKFRTSYISWQERDMALNNLRIFRQSDGDDITETIQPADFYEINPKKYIVKMNISDNSELVIAEPYNSNWKAYLIGDDGKKTEISNHFKARGYANGWKIKSGSDANKILVEYYPERLIWRGMAISLATALFLLIYLIKYYYAAKIRKKRLAISEK